MSNAASSAFQGDVCSCLTLPLVHFKGVSVHVYCLTLPLVHFKGMSVRVKICL